VIDPSSLCLISAACMLCCFSARARREPASFARLALLLLRHCPKGALISAQS
jgi:hypothetical protein